MSTNSPILVTGVPGRVGALRPRGLPEHAYEHLLTMAKLHDEGRYDRLTHDVEAILGRPATSARDFVARHAASFAP
jgi:NAD(P)H dehydrogenase (quinone)